VSGGRRLGLIAAAAAGVVLFVGALVARRAAIAPSPAVPPGAMPAAAPVSPPVPRAVGGVIAPPLAPPAQGSTPPTAPAPQLGSTPVLTPLGASRALEAIGKNEQMRRLFMRLQPLGLSPEQQDRVLLILGTAALRPSQESPTLEALRADGGSRVLSEDEANRVRNERQRIDERAARALRPALAAVLTPSQLAWAGLGGVPP
jgi:hypothetical protein